MEKLIITKEHITKEHIAEANLLEEMLAETVASNRRRFLKRGGLAAAAVATAGMWMTTPPKARAADDGRTDVQLLSDAILFEGRAVNTYGVVASQKGPSGEELVKGVVLSAVRRFALDHQAHVVRMKEVLTQLGGTVVPDPTDTTLEYANLKPGPNSLLASETGIMRYALGVEVHAMKEWSAYATYSENASAKRLFLDIAPNEAVHASIIRAALKLVIATSTDYDNADPGKAIVPFSFASSDAPKF